MTTPATNYELERIEALLSLDILDTPEEHEYDELVKLASEICDTPISLVSLVDRERQWFKAAVGLAAKETPRSVSFCSHAIQRPDLFVIENAMQDDRFRNNLLVTGEPGIRFYAGIPLHSPNGFAVGTLCVIDTVPRTLTENQKNALIILGRQVKARMELRFKQNALERAAEDNARLAATLRDRNSLFLAFMNNGPFVSYIKDAEGRMVFYNQQLAKRYDVSPEEWTGLKDAEIWPAAVAEAFRQNDLEILNNCVPVEFNEVSPGADGDVTHWKSFKFPLRLEDGRMMLAGMSLDVTEDLRRQKELEKTTEEKMELARSLESTTTLFQTFVKNNPNVCYFKSDQGRYLAYNGKFAELFGITGEEWLGKTDREVLPPEIADEFMGFDEAILQKDEVFEISRRLTNAAGETVWLKSIKFPIRMSDGHSILAGVAIDVTREIEKGLALTEANRQLERLATTDALTGLSNRRVFEERIAREFTTVGRSGRLMSVLLMDIDNFKKRNDTYGHATGDEALRLLGRILLETVRLDDMAARIGGEEFAVLLPDTELAGASEFARRIQQHLRDAYLGPMPLTVSVGIATADGETRDWEHLVSLADNAMYEAKRAGKDRIAIHTEPGVALESYVR